MGDRVLVPTSTDSPLAGEEARVEEARGGLLRVKVGRKTDLLPDLGRQPRWCASPSQRESPAVHESQSQLVHESH